MTTLAGNVGPIKHVFVLMLENRSFDHIFGFSNLTGLDAVTGQPTQANGVDPATIPTNPDPRPEHTPVAANANATPFQLSATNKDPGHEFHNTLVCLCGADAWGPPNIDSAGRLVGNAYPQAATGKANSGFVENYAACGADRPDWAMNCFTPTQLPVLNALAREFVLCDGWYSSLPGPTWPNRFFVHAASSAGLDDSPCNVATAEDYALGFELPNGTIFKKLENKGQNWKVIEGDSFPQVLAIKGMTTAALEGHFHDMDDFESLINDDGFDAAYVFIEPAYDVPHNFQSGNSMHPLGDVRKGEQLVKTVYETLRASKVWDSSVLVVLFDEHGGFYDHVAPPAAVPPGDTLPGAKNNVHNFAFDRLGLRVPCIIASPWVGKNSIDHRQYDHSSIPRTLDALFGLSESPDDALTARDRAANSFASLIQSAPRDTPATLPAPAPGVAAQAPVTSSPTDASSCGFAQIALARHLSVAPVDQHQAIKDRFNASVGNPQARANFLNTAHAAIQQWKQGNRQEVAPSVQP
jgi:phospholipase C